MCRPEDFDPICTIRGTFEPVFTSSSRTLAEAADIGPMLAPSRPKLAEIPQTKGRKCPNINDFQQKNADRAQRLVRPRLFRQVFFGCSLRHPPRAAQACLGYLFSRRDWARVGRLEQSQSHRSMCVRVRVRERMDNPRLLSLWDSRVVLSTLGASARSPEQRSIQSLPESGRPKLRIQQEPFFSGSNFGARAGCGCRESILPSARRNPCNSNFADTRTLQKAHGYARARGPRCLPPATGPQRCQPGPNPGRARAPNPSEKLGPNRRLYPRGPPPNGLA